MSYLNFRFPPDGILTDDHKEYGKRWKSVHTALKNQTLPVYYSFLKKPRPLTQVKESPRMFGGWPAYCADIQEGCYLQGRGRFSLFESGEHTSENVCRKRTRQQADSTAYTSEDNHFEDRLLEELDILGWFEDDTEEDNNESAPADQEANDNQEEESTGAKQNKTEEQRKEANVERAIFSYRKSE